MSEFLIKDEDLTSLKGKVAIVTGTHTPYIANANGHVNELSSFRDLTKFDLQVVRLALVLPRSLFSSPSAPRSSMPI